MIVCIEIVSMFQFFQIKIIELEVVGCIYIYIIGESDLIMSTRQLMHSCILYEDCLNTLKIGIRDKIKAQLTIKGKSTNGTKLKQSMELIFSQIQQDCNLLNTIKSETLSVAHSSSEYSVFRNVLLSQVTGRVEKLKNLETELLKRVQIITAFMMKDVWNVSYILILYYLR